MMFLLFFRWCCLLSVAVYSLLMYHVDCVDGLRAVTKRQQQQQSSSKILQQPEISMIRNNNTSTTTVGTTATVPQLRQRQLEDASTNEDLIPTFLGNGWKKLVNYPIKWWLAEANGAVVGNYLVITGGFASGVQLGTPRTFALDISTWETIETQDWIEMEPNPVWFWTHSAHAVKDDHLLFMCGGYIGPNPGPHMDDCHVFDILDGPTGSWSPLPKLPQGRGGGGMVYVEQDNALLFTLGAERDGETVHSTVDKRDTWMLYLDDMDGGWVSKVQSPYEGNHVTAIAAKGCEQPRTRYYFFGGQEKESEGSANIDDVWEWMPVSEVFVQRQSMIRPKGHITTSVFAYGCGFITVGGTMNGITQTDEIMYYSIDDDEWMQIGTYARALRTAVCGVYANILACSTGYTMAGWARLLSFPETITTKSTDPPTDVPTIAPTDPPTMAPNTIDRDPARVIFSATFQDSMEGFKYRDDIFRGTNRPFYARGRYKDKYGRRNNDGGLNIRLGNADDNIVSDGMSGGFVYSYTLDVDAPINVELKFYYKIWMANVYEVGEYVEVLCSIDDALIGIHDDVDYIEQLQGLDGGAERHYDKGWKEVTLLLGPQMAGTYKLSLGGYNNQKQQKKAKVLISFDDIILTAY